jgi:hypothetical protein
MQECRRYPRTRIFKAAKVFGQAQLADCVVRDITACGARLVMVSTRSVSDKFDLSFDGARTLRACRVIWRTATDIGLQFSEASFRSAD